MGISFLEINFFLIILVLLFSSWLYFFKLNHINIISSKVNSDVNVLKNNQNNLDYLFFLNYSLIVLFIYFIFLYTFRGWESLIWWGHFKLTNYNFYLLYIILLLFLLVFLFFKESFFFNNVVNYNFFFIYLNLLILFPLLFIANSLFSFFFFLELISSILFINFIITFNTSYNIYSLTHINYNKLNKSYANMLFYQYWSSFFSSIFFVFSIIYFYSLIGSNDWVLLNYLLEYNNILNFSNNSLFTSVVCIFLFISFFIKIGITPIQLYKIEVYKGLSLYSIYFYTVFFFFVFFLYFIFFILINLSGFLFSTWYFILFILLISLVSTMNYLFNTFYLKAFFSYSSVFNSLIFLLTTIIIIS